MTWSVTHSKLRLAAVVSAAAISIGHRGVNDVVTSYFNDYQGAKWPPSMTWLNLDEREGAKMAESPSTMTSVKQIRDLLDELIEKEIHQTEVLTAIQNEILTAIKDVRNAIECLHSTYRSMHEESTGNVHRVA